MSKGKRKRGSGGGRRGSGGHPAKVAARREEESVRRQIATAEARVMREILGDAAALGDPLEAELMASSMLGTFWLERDELIPDEFDDSEQPEPQTDWALAFGLPVIERVARRGGPGTVPLLHAIAVLEPGSLGARAQELAGDLTARGEPVPDWTGDIGGLEYVRAATVREGPYEDAVIVLIEAHAADGSVHGVGALIDATQGEVATELMVIDSIETVERNLREDEDAQVAGARVEELAVGIAGAWVHAAMGLTDLTEFPLFDDEYPELRALVLARAGACAEGLPPFVDPPSQEERGALLADFLASPEGAAIEPESAEATIAETAIAFCADDVDGRPLRWSPSLVELYIEEWAPRAFIDREELGAALPAGLEAWVRYAGRCSGLPDDAVTATVDAIGPSMERAEEADVFSESEMERLIDAADAAGVDIDDSDALLRFIDEWRARMAAGEAAAGDVAAGDVAAGDG